MHAAPASKAPNGRSGNARRAATQSEQQDQIHLREQRIRRLESDLAKKDKRILELEQPGLVSVLAVCPGVASACQYGLQVSSLLVHSRCSTSGVPADFGDFLVFMSEY